MTPLATILLELGMEVSGSDLADPPTLGPLRARGASIVLGHAAANVGNVDVVIASSAVPQDNPELSAARARRIPCVKHSVALGSLMRRRRGIAVSGTHGKTTTSALSAVVLDVAGRSPSFHVGSEILGYGVFGHLGQSDLFVAEADEYDRRFLDLDPYVAVVTSVEPDHLDYFGDFEAVKDAFRSFLGRVRPAGLIVVCADDPAARDLPAGAVQRITYGFAGNADWRVTRWKPCDGSLAECEVAGPSGATCAFTLQLRGRHNAANAAAVVAVCAHLGVPMDRIARGLSAFQGTRRRFEILGVAGGVTVVDDYAHHPTAVRVTLEAARDHYQGSIWAIFQPHTAHRTASLMEEFRTCFASADHVVMTPTYRPAGREQEGEDRTIDELLRGMRHRDARSLSPSIAASYIADAAQPGDLVLIMGAGDIGGIGKELLTMLARRGAPP
jgi:UDP-N-acetylmuramate--alanine ligase